MAELFFSFCGSKTENSLEAEVKVSQFVFSGVRNSIDSKNVLASEETAVFLSPLTLKITNSLGKAIM